MTTDRDATSLQLAYAAQKQALDLSIRQTRERRAPIRWMLITVIVISTATTLWIASLVYGPITQGFILDCPRLSTLHCHRLMPNESGYWIALLTRGFMGLLCLSAAVVAAAYLRAFLRPTAEEERMRERLRQLQADMTGRHPAA
ncbi:hypothetical protein IMZ29_14020 [Achromobacter sp. GG226]|uniref:hypothetical protein n=1 Tax=Verticiella alkaliphila TaxID=2779529 RepID=UPI001C0DD133|nr:hypothetical protein [Verticiella sp. GG226]MBU4611608.1 hypothetical protein [Verticiella sp. GG226]